eukprot:CAMPEP_0182430438 /NCGR_PEP_ID=MMETSP1167-20130531/40518_1 /TAXON_ID=2988 /ORGANISM="Mallomonas Sp, Strain CCMP3275" /LENGTH=112 /DNA_ID=CAMNT_0024615527 /DNA_START=509 /DNA_END=847 /DNA_ORIENTATION=-
MRANILLFIAESSTTKTFFEVQARLSLGPGADNKNGFKIDEPSSVVLVLTVFPITLLSFQDNRLLSLVVCSHSLNDSCEVSLWSVLPVILKLPNKGEGDPVREENIDDSTDS